LKAESDCRQKPVITRGEEIDCELQAAPGNADRRQVTLRGEQMYEFFDRLVSIALRA